MSFFQISDIRETFSQDLHGILSEARGALELLVRDPANDAAGNAVWRHGHTLRGLGLQVQAAALAGWGGELERLCAAAKGWLLTDPARSGEVFKWIQAHLPVWDELHRATIAEDFLTADRIRTDLGMAAELELAEHLHPPMAGPAVRRSPEPETGSPVWEAPPLRRWTPAAPARVRLSSPRLQVRPAPASEIIQAGPDEIATVFREEAHECLDRMRAEFALLERTPAAEFPWIELHRQFHTIKGAAAILGGEALAAMARRGEERTGAAAEQPGLRTREQMESCLEAAVEVAQEIGFVFSEAPAPEIESLHSSQVAMPASVVADEVDIDLVETFVIEAREQADGLEQAALRWEKGQNAPQQAAAVKRAFHTLKGAANSIGLRTFGAAVHEAEDVLDTLNEQASNAPSALWSFLLTAVDQIREYARALESKPASPWLPRWQPTLKALRSSLASPAAIGVATEETLEMPVTGDDHSRQGVRITNDQLESLLNLVGETVIDRNRVGGKLGLLATQLRSLREKDGRLHEAVSSFHEQFEWNFADRGRAATSPARPASPVAGTRLDLGFSDLEWDRYDQFNILSRGLLEIAEDVHAVISEMEGCLTELGHDHEHFAQSSRQFQGALASLSLVPMETLYPRLQRAFRDACQAEIRDATLILDGGAAQIDRSLLDRLYAPLLHLLRNAVAHGVEDPAIRSAAGKPAPGTVRLTSRQVADRIVIELSDDGAGIDVEAVRRAAITRGLLTGNEMDLSPDRILELLCRPGFSTAAEVTSVAGRGTGMDVVATEIERLNGTLTLRFTPGEGTTWRLHLPLTLLISDAVLVEAAGQRFAFPLGQVEIGVLLTEAPIAPGQKVGRFPLGESFCPAWRLSDLLGLPASQEGTQGVLVSVGERRGLLVVDRILGRQEVVVKPLDPLTARHPFLNGATVDPEGSVISVLNPAGLLKSAGAITRAGRAGTLRPATRTAGAARPPRILVVDDSLSVRKVQEGLVRRLGCEPVLAFDGLDGLEKLRAHGADLVLTDLEMPRLNGYELVSEMRSMPAWANIPVIVISSRSADKYITRAMQVGAHSFLPKPFNEGQLSALLRKHLSWEGPV